MHLVGFPAMTKSSPFLTNIHLVTKASCHWQLFDWCALCSQWCTVTKDYFSHLNDYNKPNVSKLEK